MNKKNIYFDIAATTPIDPIVIKKMNEINTDFFGNPSSIHYFGQKSHNLIERCLWMVDQQHELGIKPASSRLEPESSRLEDGTCLIQCVVFSLPSACAA